jgi:hypothetical protein
MPLPEVDDVDSAVAAYLDDALQTLLGGPGKVFPDWNTTEPMPYVNLVQIGEDLEYQSAGPDGGDSATGPGELQISIFASRRQDAYAIGRQTIAVLKDAELLCNGGTILEMRPASQSWIPEPLTGLDPDEDSIFHRMITFHYAVQRYSP